ncbi:hypothetical protein CLV84_0806 [Neolewinella xylanilytica]|uniref:Uncharacterized protein n=1 Tax=Neolewinella xylanilytica TaxID=1514080 RepID=A0A2S6I8P0_9BACT|nr:hypothetical protein CLV84_0806 [Neolewinella xylanilytica]
MLRRPCHQPRSSALWAEMPRTLSHPRRVRPWIVAARWHAHQLTLEGFDLGLSRRDATHAILPWKGSTLQRSIDSATSRGRAPSGPRCYAYYSPWKGSTLERSGDHATIRGRVPSGLRCHAHYLTLEGLDLGLSRRDGMHTSSPWKGSTLDYRGEMPRKLSHPGRIRPWIIAARCYARHPTLEGLDPGA